MLRVCFVDLDKLYFMRKEVETFHFPVKVVKTEFVKQHPNRTQTEPLLQIKKWLTCHPSSERLRHTAEQDALSSSADPSRLCSSPARKEGTETVWPLTPDLKILRGLLIRPSACQTRMILIKSNHLQQTQLYVRRQLWIERPINTSTDFNRPWLAT